MQSRPPCFSTSRIAALGLVLCLFLAAVSCGGKSSPPTKAKDKSAAQTSKEKIEAAPAPKEDPPKPKPLSDPCQEAARLIRSGEMTFWDGQEKIIRSLETCIERKKNDPDLQFQLAVAHQRHLQLDKAIAVFRGALKLKPGDLEGWRQYAWSLNVVGEPPGAGLAESELDAAYASAGAASFDEWMLYAKAYNVPYKKDALEVAARKYRAALALVPNQPQALNALGLVLMQLGENREGLELLKKAAEDPQAGAEAGFHYALALRRASPRDWDGQRAALKRAMEFDARTGRPVLQNRARWLLENAFDAPPAAGAVSASGGGLRLTDATRAAGLADTVSGEGSVSAMDADGDGRDDLFVHAWGRGPRLFVNNGSGAFREATRTAGFEPGDRSGAAATPIADVDNDGDLDVFSSRGGWHGKMTDRLYRNDGKGRFRDAAEEAGVAKKAASFGAAFSDLNLDGFADLYVAVGALGDGGSNLYYENLGGGKFKERSGEVSLNYAGTSIAVAAVDLNYDRTPEILIAGRHGGVNLVMQQNPEGRYFEITQYLTQDMSMRFGNPHAHGVAVLDYNGDALLDLFFASQNPNWEEALGAVYGEPKLPPEAGPALFRGDLEKRFVNVSAASGLGKIPASTAGATVADLDNDGLQDLVLANGSADFGRLDRMYVLRNRGDGTFEEAARAAGANVVGKGNAAIAFDPDGDGDLDLYLQQGGGYPSDQWADVFLRNDTKNEENWIGLNLNGTDSNRAAIGVRLALTCGQKTLVRTISSGSGLGAANSLTSPIGLGRCETLDRLEIFWPSGRLSSFEDLPVGKLYRVVENEPAPGAATAGKARGK